MTKVGPHTTLIGARIVLRPLAASDFEQWRRVRRDNHDRLTRWEPMRSANGPDVVEDRSAFAMRCHAREREWQIGAGYGFGIFLGGILIGEININAVQRGPFQNSYVGYWIDEAHSGRGYTPEALVLVLRFVFEDLRLHRAQISIVPRNLASHRVVEKLGIRGEGVAQRYLEINGVWEDHVRYAITTEEWATAGPVLMSQWLVART